MKIRNSIYLSVAVLAVAIVCGFGGTALADSFFKQLVHTDAFEMMGQTTPEKNDITTMWLTEGKAYSQTGSESAIIFDAEKGVMYMVDHEKKEYSAVPMDLFGSGNEGETENDEMSQMKQMAQTMMGSMEVTVTAADETEKIGDWNCTKYNVTLSMAMMESEQELWATEDIDVDYMMLQVVGGGMMAQMPGFDEVLEKMKQIKGVPVKTIATATIMGKEVVTTTELTEYAEKDAPDGIYDIPKGYKKVKMGMGMGGH